jgi:cobalamin synthase
LLFSTYTAHHPAEAAMLTKMPLPDSPRTMMLLTGPMIGAASGVVLGLLAWIAGKIFGKKA